MRGGGSGRYVKVIALGWVRSVDDYGWVHRARPRGRVRFEAIFEAILHAILHTFYFQKYEKTGKMPHVLFFHDLCFSFYFGTFFLRFFAPNWLSVPSLSSKQANTRSNLMKNLLRAILFFHYIFNYYCT